MFKIYMILLLIQNFDDIIIFLQLKKKMQITA